MVHPSESISITRHRAITHVPPWLYPTIFCGMLLSSGWHRFASQLHSLHRHAPATASYLPVTICHSALPRQHPPSPKPALRTNPRARALAHHTGRYHTRPGPCIWPLHPGPTSEPRTTRGARQHSPPATPTRIERHTRRPGANCPPHVCIFRSGFAFLHAH